MTPVTVYREQFELLAGPFREWPDLPCLVCHRGALEPDISPFESKKSVDSRVGAAIWDGRKKGFFHGALACSRTMCGNKYAVTGDWTDIVLNDEPDDLNPVTLWNANDSDSKLFAERVREILTADRTGEDLAASDPNLIGLEVKHVLPPLPLIALPEATPAEVAVLVDSASSVLLSDPSAASTRIRTAIEALLDEQRIRKTQPSNRSKRLGLHQRIELFGATNTAAATQLMAMKSIGNVSSHEATPLPLGFVLDGIEHFARAIEILYDRQDVELERRAAQIIKRGSKLSAKSLGVGRQKRS
jgi:hypothetical protein